MVPILSFLPLILTLAPEIAKWIGGDKAGNVTEKAADVIRAVTGEDDPNKAAVVLADPQKSVEAKIALAKIAAEMQAEETRARLDQVKAELADIANARSQTIELARVGSAAQWAAPAISFVVVMGFFIAPFVGRYLGTTDQIWLGALIGGFSSVISYWLGASEAGKRAQEATTQIAAKQAETAARSVPVQPPQPVSSVVVVPPAPSPAPVSPPAPSPAPVVPSPVPAPAPPVAAPEWRQGPYGGARWRVLPEGVWVEGDPSVARSVGQPVTIRRIWQDYGAIIRKNAEQFGVPAEIITMTIATESGGKPKAFYNEPDGRTSVGLMQILIGTASEVLGRNVMHDQLNDPELNIEAGTRYILKQKNITWFDPVLVAAAYNAGGLYPPREQDKNRFNLRSTGDHLERAIRWYGDICFVSREDRWFS